MHLEGSKLVTKSTILDDKKSRIVATLSTLKWRPDLVDAKVANVLPRKSVDVRDDGHPGYLCLHLFIPIIIIMAMTISAILIVIVIGILR